MDFTCYKCQKLLHLSDSKIPFRAYCDFCLADLHVCKNCKFYSIGQPNDCRVPDTDPIFDREKANFCEEFRLNENPTSQKTSSIDDVSDRLFGPSKEKSKPTKTLEDLFKDL